jgi:hypothetical protein
MNQWNKLLYLSILSSFTVESVCQFFSSCAFSIVSPTLLVLVADTAFPRPQVIRGLLHAMRTQQKLSKVSSSTLIDLGQAISGNATSEETTLLIDSTLVQEAYARNASLQALQVITLSA